MSADFNLFDEVFAVIDGLFHQVVRKVAFDIEAGAKGRAPVDTGFLRSSIYVKTEDSSDNSASGPDAFPEVAAPEHNAAIIAVGATYGIFLEYGTHKMAAQPYLTPAAEEASASFLEALVAVAGG